MSLLSSTLYNASKPLAYATCTFAMAGGKKIQFDTHFWDHLLYGACPLQRSGAEANILWSVCS